ncbi:MAG TPA: thiamine pyrophosphate-dependent enzyme, partial [Kofleriaceae bacterium]|nr:thiamine pyrophosphate-dependent enzyme [Kofleriaceae bacterium]
LNADGSTMYTPQALWTLAREQLDVTTIIFNNGAYAILRLELLRTGAAPSGPGPKTQAMFSLSPPAIDFVALATSMGVAASRATTTDEFVEQLRRAMTTRGPCLIDAVVPSLI